MIHYVEDGTEAFTENGRLLTQVSPGAGYLAMEADSTPEIVPLTTVLTEDLRELLFADGLEGFLSLQAQMLTCNGQQLDFDGPYGQYYGKCFSISPS